MPYRFSQGVFSHKVTYQWVQRVCMLFSFYTDVECYNTSFENHSCSFKCHKNCYMEVDLILFLLIFLLIFLLYPVFSCNPGLLLIHYISWTKRHFLYLHRSQGRQCTSVFHLFLNKDWTACVKNLEEKKSSFLNSVWKDFFFTALLSKLYAWWPFLLWF